MVRGVGFGLVALAASGCVSSGTWAVIDEVEARLGGEVATDPIATGAQDGGSQDQDGGAARAVGEQVADCRALAERAVRLAAGLRAPQRRARAALDRARAAGALPAPSASIEVWDFPIGDPALADRQGMYMLGVAQSFPAAGSLDGRARAEAEQARALLAEIDERAREVRDMAMHACIERAAAGRERAAIEQAERWAARATELVRARRAASGEPIADLAGLELERARLARRRAELQADEERASAALESLVGPGVEIARDPLDLALEDEPALQALLARALAARGEVRAAEARARAAQARAEAAEAEASMPAVMLQATYMQMPGMRPGLGAMLALSLPWLWSGERDAARAARSEAIAADEERAWLEHHLRVEIAERLAAVRAAYRALRAIVEIERPAAERALEAALASYATTGTDPRDWIEAWRARSEIAMDEVRARAAIAHARAALEAVVGAPIEPEGAR